MRATAPASPGWNMRQPEKSGWVRLLRRKTPIPRAAGVSSQLNMVSGSAAPMGMDRVNFSQADPRKSGSGRAQEGAGGKFDLAHQAVQLRHQGFDDAPVSRPTSRLQLAAYLDQMMGADDRTGAFQLVAGLTDLFANGAGDRGANLGDPQMGRRDELGHHLADQLRVVAEGSAQDRVVHGGFRASEGSCRVIPDRHKPSRDWIYLV